MEPVGLVLPEFADLLRECWPDVEVGFDWQDSRSRFDDIQSDLRLSIHLPARGSLLRVVYVPVGNLGSLDEVRQYLTNFGSELAVFVLSPIMRLT